MQLKDGEKTMEEKPLWAWNSIIIFYNVGPPKESIFLTTIYGLYFSHDYITELYIRMQI